MNTNTLIEMMIIAHKSFDELKKRYDDHIRVISIDHGVHISATEEGKAVLKNLYGLPVIECVECPTGNYCEKSWNINGVKVFYIE